MLQECLREGGQQEFCKNALKDPALATVLSLEENYSHACDIFTILTENSELLEGHKELVKVLFDLIDERDIAEMFREKRESIDAELWRSGFHNLYIYFNSEKPSPEDFLITQQYKEIVLELLRDNTPQIEFVQKKYNRLVRHMNLSH